MLDVYPESEVQWRPVGGGKAGELVRSLDWSQTPLGPIGMWPQSLRSMVDMVLACEFPMVVLWGRELIQIYNDRYAQIMGARHPDGMGQRTQDCWPELWHSNEPTYARVWRGEALTNDNQLFQITRNGAPEDAYFTLCRSPLRDEAGEVAGALVTVLEVTQQLKMEKALRVNERRLRALVAATSYVMFSMNPDWTEMRRLKATGLPWSTHAPNRGWLEEYIYPEDQPLVTWVIEDALRNKSVFELEHRVRRADGTVGWTLSRAVPLMNERGEITEWFGAATDVTDRKHAQEELRLYSERLHLAEKAGNIATWDWVLASGEFMWDKDGYRVFGRPCDEVANIDDVKAMVHKDDADGLMAALKSATNETNEFNHEFRVCWPDDSVHWLIGRGKTVSGSRGKPVRLVGIFLDVTGRRQTEATLRQSEKLAAVGQLASTIAHEINNPLESVTNLFYLARASGNVAEIHNYLETAEYELRRVADITSQTLRFHRQLSNPTEASCDDLIAASLMLYQGRLATTKIQVEKRKRARCPVRCFEGEIRQVLNNLIGNAIDAMPQGGRLLIRSAECTDCRTRRRGLRITVADTGRGMSKRTMEKIFSPFFTTKGTAGTGLGLWVSHEIVERHRGRLRVRSSERPRRSGSVFALFLPFDAASR
jgi:two-component system, sporulation sensor kinase E